MSNSLQIKDIYDYAYEIAQEFDKIVDSIDIEQLTPLINKVINVLEILEDSVKQLEQLEQENASLRAKNIQLNCEKSTNEEEKLNLKQAFEELEDSWTQESKSLRAFIDKLKKENNVLTQSLSSEKKIAKVTDDDCLNSVITDQKNLIAKLQLHLKQKDAQLETNQATNELLNSKIEDLLKLNKSLHLRYQEVKDLLQASYSEEYEYKFKQNQQEQKILDLENKYDALEKSIAAKNECTLEVASQSNKKTEDNETESKCLIEKKQNELEHRIWELQNELMLTKYQCDEFKEKYKTLNAVTESQTQSLKENGRIQQIFRLFLGVVHINI